MRNDIKPAWIKVKALSEDCYKAITDISKKYNLNTVCQSALCPNINECWSAGTATFLLMGDICARNCRFCSVKTGDPQGRLNNYEPLNIAKAVQELNLDYVVLTSVDRDDLEDGGSGHIATTIKEIKKINDKISVEALIPDFAGNINALKKVICANPDVIGHNIETVERLSPKIRDKKASYRQSLDILKAVKEINPEIIIKSSLLLGFGETEPEIKKTLLDLKEHNVDIVTLGQYLRPSKKQLPVVEYIKPEKFKEYEDYAENLGFLYVISTPLARSSFMAGKYFKQACAKRE